MNTWLILFLCLLITYSVAVLGSWFTRKGLGAWYKNLKKPLFNPPRPVFLIVWPILYTLMALALWIAIQSNQGSLLWILIPYGSQLFFNCLWSFFFFTLRSPLLALIDLGFLLGTLVWTLVVFYSVSNWAGNLLLPYLAWVLFAGYLNRFIWLNNKNS